MDAPPDKDLRAVLAPYQLVKTAYGKAFVSRRNPNWTYTLLEGPMPVPDAQRRVAQLNAEAGWH